MKIFLDRLGFVFHRPRFFGKAFTSIVAQGIYGGNKIVGYLDFVGMGLGFNYYPTHLGPLTKAAGHLFDSMATRNSRHRES
jgi:hypothetical protein